MKHEQTPLSKEDWQAQKALWSYKKRSRWEIDRLLRTLFKLDLWETEYEANAYSSAREIANRLYTDGL